MSNDAPPINPNFLKHAKLVREKMIQVQKATRQKTVTASAGGGVVTATANGANQLVSITVDKQVINPEEVELLCDLILAAVNEALSLSQAMVSDEISKISSGLGLPELF
ncbi:MAG: YbaB/EbfC family nucleoid-associated protein [Deltaproteobacteria bacterium]|jgi:DNA-binding YbaB/EbfC family protein|nr:YbaB/EbfC family nucleoid-associated protein [Deltaproteobacteria bacterium]